MNKPASLIASVLSLLTASAAASGKIQTYMTPAQEQQVISLAQDSEAAAASRFVLLEKTLEAGDLQSYLRDQKFQNMRILRGANIKFDALPLPQSQFVILLRRCVSPLSDILTIQDYMFDRPDADHLTDAIDQFNDDMSACKKRIDDPFDDPATEVHQLDGSN